MKLLFVADGRSQIALNWMRYFIQAGHEVHLASSFPCPAEAGLASLTVVTAAFSEVKVEQAASGKDAGGGKARTGGRMDKLAGMLPVGVRTKARQWLGPLTLPGAAQKLRAVIEELRPELVHAMRIPYEGMVAALAMEETAALPLLVSVWGNDFTLHARANPWRGRLTRRGLGRADALHPDCQRDQRLAREWGFAADKPGIVLPGGGGIQMEVFYPASQAPKAPVVIQPRGIRAYVRNDTFFQAVPLVLKARPEVRFLCPAMADQAQARRWVSELGLEAAVALLPKIPRPQMAELFRQAQVVLSITTHDGTPNTLLEALACGCFPIAGDIEALHEWIRPGENGLLVDPRDPAALAKAILQALGDEALRARARQENLRLVQERAEYGKIMRGAQGFYEQLVKSSI